MTKTKTKRSATSHPRARAAGRRGIAKRGGWVDQRVAEILKSPLSLSEKTQLVYHLLAEKPPIPGDHLPPIEVIRSSLARSFQTLASEPDGPLTPQNMPGTVYLILQKALRSWAPANSHKRRDGRASFITYLTNRLKWFCQHQLEQARKRSREIPLSALLERNWGDRDDIEEDYFSSLGFVPTNEGEHI